VKTLTRKLIVVTLFAVGLSIGLQAGPLGDVKKPGCHTRRAGQPGWQTERNGADQHWYRQDCDDCLQHAKWLRDQSGMFGWVSNADQFIKALELQPVATAQN